MKFQFSNDQKGLIIGGSSEIAQAVGHGLNQLFPELELHSVSRNKDKNVKFKAKKYYFDYFSEIEWDNYSSLIGNSKFDFVLSFVGALNTEGQSPEKNLRSLEFENLVKTLEINLKPMFLGMKSLERKLNRQELTLVSAISAKVGSITDNQLGGWYSYRISKAALNMFLKTLSSEFKFKNPKCIINAIHPGTTKTVFTRDYLKTIKHTVHEPEETAKNLIEVWQSLEVENSGEFRNWDGTILPW